MNTEIIILSFCLFASLANLFSTVLLSNFVFRVLVGDRKAPGPSKPDDRGLVDLKYSPTYDPRFRDG